MSPTKFERLLKRASYIQHYSLRLYVTGTTARSSRAVANIRVLCDEYLRGHYDLEVVDIYQHPTVAMDQQIVAAPTLIKKLPAPPKRLIGDLSDRNRIIAGLNLQGQTEINKLQWSAPKRQSQRAQLKRKKINRKKAASR